MSDAHARPTRTPTTLGVTLTEICDLDKLAEFCAARRRSAFFHVAAPLKVHRATGSPVDPVAVL